MAKNEITIAFGMQIKLPRRRSPELQAHIERLQAAGRSLGRFQANGGECGCDEHHIADVADAFEQLDMIVRRARASQPKEQRG